jgi:hypothetical protein
VGDGGVRSEDLAFELLLRGRWRYRHRHGGEQRQKAVPDSFALGHYSCPRCRLPEWAGSPRPSAIARPVEAARNSLDEKERTLSGVVLDIYDFWGVAVIDLYQGALWEDVPIASRRSRHHIW